MKKRNNPLRLTLSYVLLIIIAVVSVYPVLWIFLSSLRPGAALFSERLWPEAFTLSHYGELFNNPSFMYGRWYLNTLKIAFFTMIFSTLMVTLGMYALSVSGFAGGRRFSPPC